MKGTAKDELEKIAWLKLLELSESDVAAGRLFTTEEAFERARRTLEEHEEKNTP